MLLAPQVIQEYLGNPLLIDPAEVSIDGSVKPEDRRGFKVSLHDTMPELCLIDQVFSST